MQSYRLNADLALELVKEPTPTPGRGQVLVRVKATSLNSRDTVIASGRYPLPPLPNLIQLSDAAGVIEAVGPDTTRFRVGDRVVNSFHPTWFGGPMRKVGRMYGTDIDGWLSDYAVVDENALVSMPEHLSFEEAATLPCAALTGWSAVAGVGPGDTVLVQGSGGVSLFALRFARTAGARVLATTSSEAKAERLRALGASDVVNYAETPGWGSLVRELTDDRGVDTVVEVGGAATISQSVEALAPHGTISLVGHLGGAGQGMDLMPLSLRFATLRAIGVGSRGDLEEMNRVLAQHRIRPVMDRVFPFSEAPQAFEHFAHGSRFGKVVISHEPE
ncbi:zinc-dependent alcohol dehydrogenase family protein [Streptomyces sedi]|uniref:NAD(P)-dependent alcohol dehydrogenase n=1 Tax=Streptomyces sedi TaxID=555059 RepID=A0A5C4V451_9ACTN|nr:NAD(P)-dependent alcohol dehydrogenase [Streptomyces sedi]TNM30563.1 NAD(P)-dependent alcohol dehydrogenase [Streptomyces sedi]